jgi:WD40 repeat protein
VTAAAFAPDGWTLASGSLDGRVILWDEATGVELATLTEAPDFVLTLVFAPDGRTLAVADGPAVRLWDVATREERAVLHGHTGKVLAQAFAPDGRTLASGGYDRTVRLWDLTRDR